MRITALALALAGAGAAYGQMNVSGSLPVTILDTAPAAQSLSAVNAAASVALVGQTGAGVLLSGTWTATLTPEISFDGGSNWVATYFYQTNPAQVVSTVTQNGSYGILCASGASHVRVRASAYTSGTVTATLRAAAAAPAIAMAAGSSGASITSAATTAVKGTAGILRRVVVGTGVASATVKLFNVAAASCSGTPGSGAAGVITLPSTLANPFTIEINQTFSAGICVVTSGATNVLVIFD